MSDNTDGMSYQQDEDGVHVFRFTGTARDAVDAFIVTLQRIYGQAPADSHIHLYIDMTDAETNVSLRTLARRIQPFFSEYPDRPAGSLAVITKQGSAFTLLNNFLVLFSRGKDRFRFFRDGQQDEMRRWLLLVR